MWRSRSTRSAWCFACSVISAGAAPEGAPATAADAGELVEARGDIVGRFGGSLELIVRCCGASFRTCRTSSPSSNASSARAMSRAAPRPCIPSRAALPPLAPAPPPAVPASWSRPCAAPIAARHGNPRRHPPRRTAHPVRCLPAPPAGDVRRRAGGVGELNPGAVASPAKDSGGPGARLHPLRPRANNAMGVIRRYS